ncbi:hypothetical protein GM182_06675 [bacterium 3DAC]|nr:hypothetical protein GM182_06675 [bacterium 3DAC]
MNELTIGIIIFVVLVLFGIAKSMIGSAKNKVVYSDGWQGTLHEYKRSQSINKGSETSFSSKAQIEEVIEALQMLKEKFGIDNPEEYIDLHLKTPKRKITLTGDGPLKENQWTTKKERINIDYLKSLLDIPGPDLSHIGFHNILITDTLQMLFQTSGGWKKVTYELTYDLFNLPSFNGYEVLSKIEKKLEKGKTYIKEPGKPYITDLDPLFSKVKVKYEDAY